MFFNICHNECELIANWVLQQERNKLLLRTDIIPDPQLPDLSDMDLTFSVFFI